MQFEFYRATEELVVRRPRLRAGTSSCVNGKICIINGDGTTSFAQSCLTTLQQKTTTSIILPFADFTLLYPYFLKLFQPVDASIQARLITITNLPVWTGNAAAESASPLLAAFHKAATTAEYTPAHLALFTALHLLREVAAVSSGVDATSLSNAVFQQQEFDIPPAAFLEREVPHGRHRKHVVRRADE
eukprot:gene11460-biopygen8323